MKFSLPHAAALATLFLGPIAHGATAPTANNDTAHITDGNPVTVTVLDNDLPGDGSTLTVSTTLPTPPTKGTAVVMADGSIVYTPTVGSFAGTDAFTYTVTNGSSQTATATVTITSRSIQPKADFVNLTRIGPVTIPVTANDVNPDGDTFSVSGFSQLPATGVVYRSGQTVTYIPTAAFAGTDTFTYEVTDFYKRVTSAHVTVSLVNLSAGTIVRHADGKVAGYLNVNAMPGGAFTAVLLLDGTRYRLLGMFDSNQQFTGIAHAADGQFVPVALAFTEVSGAMQLTATLPDGMSATEALGHLTDAGKIKAHGLYTVMLPITSTSPVTTTATGSSSTDTSTDTTNGVTIPGTTVVLTPTGETATETTGDSTTGTDSSGSSSTTGSSVPQGTGWLTVKVSGNGHVGIKGMSGDGFKFGAKGILAGTDAAPQVVLFVEPKNSTISGTLSLGDKVSGTLGWTKTRSHSDFYPGGFDVTVGASGARYEAPSAGKRALPESTTFSESGGRVGDYNSALHISKDDRGSEVNFTDTGLTLKIRRHSGVFSGSFTSPTDSDRHVHFSGVIVQGGTTDSGAGVFQGDRKAGKITLGATPSSTTTGSDTGTGSTGTDGSTTGSGSSTDTSGNGTDTSGSTTPANNFGAFGNRNF